MTNLNLFLFSNRQKQNYLQRMILLISFFLCIVIFLFERSILQSNTDVTWALIINERWFSGERPYIDFFELSAPSTYLIYTPCVWIALSLGISVELAQDVQTTLIILLCLGMSFVLLKPIFEQDKNDAWYFLLASLVIFLIMPAANFGQRELYGSALSLPLLCCIIRRLSQIPIASSLAIFAGILAGISICIKPNFCLFYGLPCLWLWIVLARQSNVMRGLFKLVTLSELAMVFVPIALYLGYCFIFVRVYFDRVLPLFVKLYMPVNRGLLEFTLYNPEFIGFLLGLFFLLIFLRKHKLNIACSVMMQAALGGFLSYLLQHKGYPYQAIPAMSFLLLSFVFALVLQSKECITAKVPISEHSSPRLSAISLDVSPQFIGGFALVLGIFMFRLLLIQPPLPTVTVDLSRYGVKPKMMQIGTEFLGTQLVHRLHGQWVGQMPLQLITFNGLLQLTYNTLTPEQVETVKSFMALDRQIALEDLTTRKPDIVFVGEYDEAVIRSDDPSAQFWQKGWLSDEDFKAALANYSICQFDHGVTLYCRNVP